jgi:hypothetical protein
MRKLSPPVGGGPGASLKTKSKGEVKSEGGPGKGTRVWGAFFWQSSLDRKAFVARASVSLSHSL